MGAEVTGGGGGVGLGAGVMGVGELPTPGPELEPIVGLVLTPATDW